VFEKPDEDINFLVKDITRFKNRNLARSVLIDPRPLNFIMTPENGYPIIPYTAEFENPSHVVKDEYLLSVIEDLEILRKEEDVRTWLNESFKVRQTLKNSKLI
jgi:TFIIF-interacting CTD phosphatase-like protein